MTRQLVPYLYLGLTFFGVAEALPQAHVPDFYQQPGVNTSREVSFDLLSGETIDPFSGMLRHQYQDLVLPGNGIDIAVTRTYHAIQKAPGIVGQPYLSGRTTTGVGWDIHFGRVYYEGPLTPLGCAIPLIGGEPLSSENPTIELPDGTRKVLFASLAGIPEEFITKDRWVATCIPGVRNEGGREYHDGGLEVRTPEGMKLTFDRRTRVTGAVGAAYTGKLAWHLTRLEDLNGNWIEVDYRDRALTQYTEIERVRAKDGRVVEFTYTNSGLGDALLTRIEAGDEIWNYEYRKIPGEALAYYYLDRVVGPEGLVWSYDYHSSGNGLHSLAKARAPTGGEVSYTYQRVDLGAFPSLSMDTTAIAAKTTSGPDVVPGTWTYRFYQEPTDDFDYTEVIGPVSREVYRHCGMRALSFSTTDVEATLCNAREGALLQKDTYELSPSSLVQTELYDWGTSQISAQWEAMPFRTYRTVGIYARRLNQTTISRDGDNYTTYFASFDAYDNPGVITEYSGPVLPYGTEPPPGRRRDQVFTYEPDLPNWLLRLVTRESMPDIPVSTPSGPRPLEFVTERSFDDRGNVITEIVNGTNRTEYTYYPNGLVETIKNARNETTRFLDYFRGIPRREERPESVTIERDVDFDGTVTSETNGRGFATAYTYDALDRMESVVTPRLDDSDIVVSYDFASPSGSSNARRTLSRGGFVEERILDGFGRVVQVKADGIYTTTRFDAAGRKVFESYPSETPPTGSEPGITYEYDAIGRLVRMEHTVDGASVEYEYLTGDRMKVTNERDEETLYTYRAFGDPDARDLAVIDSPENTRTKIARYQTGHPLTISQGDRNGPEDDFLERHFVLDTQYQLDFEFHPEIGQVELEFDPLGNKLSENVETYLPTLFTYDGLNRLRTVDYQDGFTNNVSYTYDENGNVKTLTKFPTTWTFEYDRNDNLVKQILDYDWLGLSRTFTLEYSYDERDALSTITYPSGLEVDYAPDARGWPTKVGRFADLVDYHPTGAIRQLRYANGHVTTIDLDDRQRPDRLISGNGAVDVMDLDYDYDLAGNVTHILDGLDPLQDRDFEYDGADRLTVANGPWGSGSLEYDVLGNIRRKTIGASDLLYQYTTFGSLLTGVSGERNQSFSYDPAGNIVFDGSKIYSYGHDDNLRNVVDNARGTVLRGYTYDGLDRRVAEKRQGSSDTKFTVYDRAGNLLFEVDPGRCEQRDYIRIGSMLIARRDTDIQTDGDGDEIPDCVELRWGLDPGDPGDAAEDLDGDGLTNLEEYRLGTELDDPDSDGDGMDDEFEVEFGLNPLKNDAGDDLDGDGATNLHEFLAGTLPDDDSSVPASGTPEWRFDDTGAMSFSLVIDGNGTTYFYGADRGLYAIDRFGQLVGSVDPVAPSPEMLTADGRVLAGFSSFNQAVLLDSDLTMSPPIDISRRGSTGRAALPTGELALRHEDDVYLLDADGNILWTRNLPPGSLTRVGPVAGTGGTLYVGLFYGRIVAMDRYGNTRWWKSVGSRDVNALAVGPDNTLIVVGNNRIVAFSHLGEELWNVTLTYVPRGVAVGADGTVYLVGGEAVVDVIDPAGVLQPSLNLRPGETHDIALGADGTLYVLSGSGLFVDALDSSGNLLWEYGNGEPIHPNLALTTLGSLIVPHEERVVSLKTDRAGPSRDAWAMRGKDAGRSAARPPCGIEDTDADDVPDCIERLEGLVVGVSDGADDADGDGLLNRDEVALGTGLNLADTDGDNIPDGYEVHEGLDPNRKDALDDEDSDGARNLHEFLLGSDVGLASSVPPSKSTERIGHIRKQRTFGGSIGHLGIDRDGNLYFSAGATLHSVDELLEDRWSVDLGSVNGLALDDDRVYVSGSSGALVAIPLAGGPYEELFMTPGLPRRLTRAAIAPDGTLYVGSGNNSLYAVAKTGGMLAEFATDFDIVSPPVIGRDGSVYVASRDHFLYKLTPTLDEVWKYDVERGANAAPAILEDGTVVVVTDSDFEYAVTSARELRWIYSRFTAVFGTRDNAAPVVGTDSTVIVQEQGHLRAIRPNGTLKWEEPGGNLRPGLVTWDGRILFTQNDTLIFIDEDQTDKRVIPLGSRITAGPVLARDGTVYVGTSDRRLIGIIASEFGGLGMSPWPTEAKNLRLSGYDGDVPNEPRRAPIAANEAPGIVITEPPDGVVFTAGSPEGMTFTAGTTDREDGTLDDYIVWSSDRDGELGFGATVTLGGAAPNPELSLGPHVVTASVMDHNGDVSTAIVNVNVVGSSNDPPTVTITAPSDGTSVNEGTPVAFMGTASDPEQGDLTSTIAWSSDRDGALGTGGSLLAALSVGAHIVIASVTDIEGADASDTVNVEVIAVEPTPAELVTPVPGSTIDTTEAEFHWSAGVSVAMYQLTMGTTARSSNVFDSGATPDTSALVTNIPQSGGTLYATLYSFVEGVWEPRDYTFAMGGAPVEAALVSPSAGTLLAEEDTFEWSPSNDVSQLYQLHVGNVVGGEDVFSSGTLSGITTIVVSGIPQSGGEIHVRLHSYLNNVWVFHDYLFSADGTPVKATLNAPAPGAILGESATFEWSPSNNGLQLYELKVGTAEGEEDIFSSGTLDGVTSVDVSGIPQSGGDIFVRLYSFLNDDWVYEPYQFTMGGVPAKATLVAPAAGATVGESATFEWSPSNNGVQRYQLHVGTLEGWQDVYANDSIRDTTRVVVSGIPQSGGEIYVRLYSFLNNEWVYEASTFKMDGVPTKASLTSPVAGTVVGTDATFEWSPSNNGLPIYQLDIGTIDGAQNVFSSGLVNGVTSAVVSGIPQSGGVLYVRLYSYLNNQWIFEASTFTMGGAPVKASVIAPAAGTTVGPSATFEWSPSNDALQIYQLDIGTIDGAQDVFSSGLVVGTTSAVVSGIPQSGGEIYVGLYSYLNNQWVYEASTFTMGGVPTKASLIAPAAGTIVGTSATFEWSPSNNNLPFYQLDIGTVDGAQNIFSSGLVFGTTSAVVSGIPQSGGEIYVRLYSYLNNEWVYEASTYTMAGVPTKASISTPAPGSVLGESAVFEWSPSNDHTQFYLLLIGSSPGGHDVYVSGLLSGVTSDVASGLPQDGRPLYVRLYTYLNNTWVYEEITYTAGP